MRREHGEKRDFAAGEVDGAVIVAERAAGGIEVERAETDGTVIFRWCGWRDAPEQGAQAEQQDAGFEGLAEIVVGAGFEAFDLVLGGAAGGEQEDGDVGMGGAERSGQSEAVLAGHADVEHDAVGLDGAEMGASVGVRRLRW